MKHTLLIVALFLISITVKSQDCDTIRRCDNVAFPLVADFTAETYEWFSGNDLASLTQIPGSTEATYTAILTTSSTRSFKVRTAEDSACWIVNPVVINVNDIVPPCENETLELSASIADCEECTYSWSGEGLINSSSDNASFSYSNASSSPFQVVVNAQFVEDGYECATTTEASITVNSLPDFEFSASALCLNESLSANGLDNQQTYTYLWSYNGTEPNGASIIFSESAVNEPISLTVTDQNSCFRTISGEITVHALPEIVLEGDSVLCAGEDLSLSTSVNYEEYSWTLDNSNTPVSTEDLTINSINAGSYIVSLSVTDSNGCSNDAEINVEVYSRPTATIVVPASICMNDTAVYTLDNEGTSLTQILWNSTVDSDTLQYVHNMIGSVQIEAEITDENQCSDTISVDVTVNALPTDTISGPSVICEGQTYSYTIPTNDAIAEIEWNDGSSNDTLSFTPGTSGDYNIAVQVIDDNGCIGTDVFPISVSALPASSIEGDTLICGETEFEFTATSSQANSTFIWAIADSTYSNSNSLSFDNGYGDFLIILETTNDIGCSSETTIDAAAIARPVSPLANEIKLCDGASLVLEGNADYQNEWIITNQNSTIDTLSSTDFSYELAIGDYQVFLTLTDSNQVNCITIDTASVFINANPVFTTANPQISCVGVPFEFSIAQVTVGGNEITDYTVTWTNSNGIESNENPFSDSSLTAGNYMISVEVEENTNQCSTSQELDITINTGPSFQHTVPAPVCVGSSVVLELDTVLANSYSINWQVDGFTTDEASVNLVLADSSNEYSVSVTNTENGCTSDSSYSVVSIALPEILPISLLTDGLLAMNSDADYSYTWGYTSAATGIEITISAASDYAYYDNFDIANNYYWVEYANENGCIRRVYYNAPLTNIYEAATDEYFMAYPIPAETNLTIQSERFSSLRVVDYSVFNAQGQLVQAGKESTSDKKITLNVSELSQGHYYVKFATQQNVHTIRFSK
jgi:hypothetical protein